VKIRVEEERVNKGEEKIQLKKRLNSTILHHE
jgi:hypothetical protein